jgi:hypothetical protein
MHGRCPDIDKMKQLLPRERISLEEGLQRIIKEGLFEFNQI